MFTGFEYPSLIIPLLAFLAARAIAEPIRERFPGGAAAALFAAGIAASAAVSLSVAAPWRPAAYWLAADAAIVASTMAVGAESAWSMHRGGSPARNRSRRVLAFCVPPVVGAAIALVLGAMDGSGTTTFARSASFLSAALWLSVGSGAPGTIAAAAAMAAAAVVGPAPFEAAIASAGSIAAIAVVSGLARRGGPAGAALRDFIIVPYLGLAWSLRALGLPWPAAGLAAGLAMGLGRRRPRDGRSVSYDKSASREAASRSGAYALAFIAGLGVSTSGLANALPAIAAAAGGCLVVSALVALVAGSRSAGLTAEAAAIAALLAAKRAGLTGDAAIVGVALACLIAASVTRRSAFARFDRAASPSMKAVVGVSPKAERIKRSPLGTLSFAAAIGVPGEPIRAVCVASADDGPGPSPRDAEEALVRCVAAGATAGIRVLPGVVVSASVPDGLARAALERRADAVVVGSGDALGGLLVAFPGSVIEMRRPEAFSSSRRLVAMTVAGAESSPGFIPALEAVARAWGRPAGSMEALMIGASASTLTDAARGLLDTRRVRAVSTWRDVPTAIDAQAARDVSFVAFASRPGAKAWNPGHDRLPVVLDASFPDAPLALWYLPRPRDDAAPGDAVTADAAPDDAPVERGTAWPPLVSAAFASGRVLVDMREAALVDAIRSLTDSLFPHDRGTSGRLAAGFSGVARKEPIELAPGILLLHAHSDGIDRPAVAIGSRPAGWPLAALSTPVLITVALVSPSDSGPEVHLEALTQIASAFRSLGLAERLLGAAPPSRSTGRNDPIA